MTEPNLIIYWKPERGKKTLTSEEIVEPGRAYVIKIDNQPIELLAVTDDIKIPEQKYKGGTVVPVPDSKVVKVVAVVSFPGEGRVTKVPVNSTSGRIKVRHNGRLELAAI